MCVSFTTPTNMQHIIQSSRVRSTWADHASTDACSSIELYIWRQRKEAYAHHFYSMKNKKKNLRQRERSCTMDNSGQALTASNRRKSAHVGEKKHRWVSRNTTLHHKKSTQIEYGFQYREHRNSTNFGTTEWLPTKDKREALSARNWTEYSRNRGVDL